MATSLDKLENNVQIHHWYIKRFHTVKRLQKSVQYTSGDIQQNTPKHDVNTQRNFHLFSAKTTGPIFTKILHDIVALVVLFNHAHARRYPIQFLNALYARAISARG